MATQLVVQRLEALEARYGDLETLLNQPEVSADFQRAMALSRERAGLEETVGLYRRYRQTLQELQEAQNILRSANDSELQDLAREETERLAGERDALEGRLHRTLLPQDPADERNVIVEIRAGTGGEEAALFVADLYRMYTRFAQIHRWRVDVLNSNTTGIGGFKEIVFEVKGKGAFSRLKHERGTHRVQRVPVTEAAGRIQTSAVTVAVLPEAEEVEVEIDPKDLQIDIFHSGGPGGQNVNKVASAVRIRHIPTGIISVCQEEPSQHKNRARALSVLRARLLDAERQRAETERSQARRSMVGSGDRAEKIRTYNFPQNRITDHRVSLTLHNLDRVLAGDLEELIDTLVQAEQTRLLEHGVGQQDPVR